MAQQIGRAIRISHSFIGDSGPLVAREELGIPGIVYHGEFRQSCLTCQGLLRQGNRCFSLLSIYLFDGLTPLARRCDNKVNVVMASATCVPVRVDRARARSRARSFVFLGANLRQTVK